MPEVIIENKRNMLFAMVKNLVPNAGEDKEIKPYVEKGVNTDMSSAVNIICGSISFHY